MHENDHKEGLSAPTPVAAYREVTREDASAIYAAWMTSGEGNAVDLMLETLRSRHAVIRIPAGQNK